MTTHKQGARIKTSATEKQVLHNMNHQQTSTVVSESKFITLCGQHHVLSQEEAGMRYLIARVGVLSLLRPYAALCCYSAWT